jgi:hypothetical protein
MRGRNAAGPILRCDSINDAWQSAIKIFVLRMLPHGPFGPTKKGGTMKLIASIATDRTFKAISMLSCFGLAVSLGFMAYGMDLNAVWF